MDTDEKTLELIKEVNRQKSEILKIERPNYKTNLSFVYFDQVPINLNIVTDIGSLLRMAGFVKSLEESYNNVQKWFNVEGPEFTWLGYSAGDWMHDFKAKIDKAQVASKKKKLEILENRLTAIISPAMRAKLELEAIINELEN